MIVDDCSTDNTYEICKRYAEKDSRIKLYRNPQNLKISKTLNFGLSKVTGKYVVRMDGDDISVSNRLEVMKKFLDENQNIKLVGTSAITIDSAGNEIGKTVFLDDENLIKRTLKLKNPVVHIWMTYKSVYDELNGYRLVNPTEDYDFVLRCLTSGYAVTNISNFFAYKIRVNRIGNSTNTYGIKKLKSHSYTVKNYLQRIKKGTDDFSEENYQKYIKTWKISEFLYSLSNKFLYKAISYKSKNNLILTTIFTILSFVSPHQVLYLFNTFKYKKIIKGK